MNDLSLWFMLIGVRASMTVYDDDGYFIISRSSIRTGVLFFFLRDIFFVIYSRQPSVFRFFTTYLLDCAARIVFGYDLNLRPFVISMINK